MKPLIIPEGKRWKGIQLVCYKCGVTVTDWCKEVDRPLPKCPFADRHRIKLVYHIKGSRSERRTKVLDENIRDINQIIKAAIDFEKEVKTNPPPKKIKQKSKQEITQEAEGIPPVFLLDALAWFIGYLNNENVPEHLQKRNRSEESIKDYQRAFEAFVEVLHRKGKNMKSFKVSDITDTEVGFLHSELIKERKFSSRTYNKYMSSLTTFLNTYNQVHNTQIKNAFAPARKVKTIPKAIAITNEEYQDLLSVITEENGKEKYIENGVLRTKQYFLSWLKAGIQICLETGQRREPVVSLRFSQIKGDLYENAYIEVDDLKVNRIQGRTDENEKKKTYIPISENLKRLLIESGYDKYKNSDRFVLAPEIQEHRTKTMCDQLSRGFTHYIKLTETKRSLTLKSLRKSFITQAEIQTRGDAKLISGHSNSKVLDHYLDRETLIKSIRNFSVFPNARESELEELRKQSQNHTQEKERD